MPIARLLRSECGQRRKSERDVFAVLTFFELCWGIIKGLQPLSWSLLWRRVFGVFAGRQGFQVCCQFRGSWLFGMLRVLSASLPSEVIVAREIVTTLGHTEERAAQLLERFVGYLRTQHALITSAALTDTWTPQDGTPDRTQKTVRGLAHATKGAAEMVMARRVARTSRLLQNACEELRADAPSDEARYTASAAVEVWKCEVDRLLDALKGRDLGQLVRSKRPIYVGPASHAAQPKSAAAAMWQPAVVQSTPLTAEALSANARVEG